LDSRLSRWPIREHIQIAECFPPNQGELKARRLEERLSLSIETIELAKVAASLCRAGRGPEADRVALRVAENAERLARS